MLVIHPDECIDCGVCEPECPVDAIKPGLERWRAFVGRAAHAYQRMAACKIGEYVAKSFNARHGIEFIHFGKTGRGIPVIVRA